MKEQEGRDVLTHVMTGLRRVGRALISLNMVPTYLALAGLVVVVAGPALTAGRDYWIVVTPGMVLLIGSVVVSVAIDRYRFRPKRRLTIDEMIAEALSDLKGTDDEETPRG
jgi:hypothetical protein